MTNQKAASLRLIVKLCSDKSAFEVRTVKRFTLDMRKVKLALGHNGLHEIIVDTPHMMIARIGKAEATISRDGRMLIKRVCDETEAKHVANQILSAILRQ